jgi:uncharacterized SAM-binding protein YcdF (DUF218 family)
MMRYELWNIFGAATWPIWLLLLGGCLVRLRWWRAGRWIQGTGFLLFLAIAVSPLSAWLMQSLESARPGARLSRVETIVMLAGGEQLSISQRSGRPEYSEAGERVVVTAQLQRRFPGAQLVLVGGVKLPGGRFDVDYARETLLALGVPETKMTLISSTRDTYENARAVAQLRRDPATMLLVTSAFHMRRAMLCFAHFDMQPLPYPVDSRVPKVRLSTPNIVGNFKRFDDAMHEWIGLIFYRVTGRISQLS